MDHDAKIRELLADEQVVKAVKYAMDNLQMTLATAYKHVKYVKLAASVEKFRGR